MPLIKPKDGEEKKDWMDRCLANPVMNDEYPDSKQRYAVCSSIWKNKKEKKMATNRKDLENGVMERRAFPLTEIRIEERDGKIPKITGHAAVFGKLSENLGFFREKIRAGAFKKTITEADIRALFNHDPNYAWPE